MTIEIPNQSAGAILDLVREGARALGSFTAFEAALVFHLQFQAALADEQESQKKPQNPSLDVLPAKK